MKHIVYCLTFLFIMACQHATVDTVAPEYPNWTVLRAPIDRPIVAVWGAIDKTLLISTDFSLFRSTNRGRNWQEVVANSGVGLSGIVQYRDTLFAFAGLLNGAAGSYYANADLFSTTDGQTWETYRRFNPSFEWAYKDGSIARKLLARDPVTATNGDLYRIRQYYYKDTTKTTGYLETPGVIVNARRRINLPLLHQLSSVYFDPAGRLYIAGSDAVCGREQQFSFCNSKNGRGVVYISKNPLP